MQAKLGGKLENGPLQLEDSKPYCIVGSKPLDLMLYTVFISEMMNYPDSRELLREDCWSWQNLVLRDPLLLQNPRGNEGRVRIRAAVSEGRSLLAQQNNECMIGN